MGGSCGVFDFSSVFAGEHRQQPQELFAILVREGHYTIPIACPDPLYKAYRSRLPVLDFSWKRSPEPAIPLI